MHNDLTPKMREALQALDGPHWMHWYASEIGASGSTMEALSRRGLVFVYTRPANAGRRYELTPEGRAALRGEESP
jgi:DNA-binding PadR family transcriptional regulator